MQQQRGGGGGSKQLQQQQQLGRAVLTVHLIQPHRPSAANAVIRLLV